MSLASQIELELIDALKSHDETKSSTLKLLKSAIKNKEIAQGKELDDIATGEIVASQIKQRRDSIAQYKQGNRQDLALKEQAELDILQSYLPEQLSESEITRLVDEAITKSAATSPSDMGKVMAILMPQVKGKADGSLVSQIVKEKLM